MTTTASEANNNEPDGLDSLVYDDWEGQFEFFGNKSPIPGKQQNDNCTDQFSGNNETDDDLNLIHPATQLQNELIHIDENDFIRIKMNNKFTDDGCFVKNNFNNLNFDRQPTLSSNIYKDLNNIKNQLISNVNKPNGLSDELCANLSDQVCVYMTICFSFNKIK